MSQLQFIVMTQRNRVSLQNYRFATKYIYRNLVASLLCVSPKIYINDLNLPIYFCDCLYFLYYNS